MARTRCYRAGVLVDEDFPVDQRVRAPRRTSRPSSGSTSARRTSATWSWSPRSSGCTGWPSRTPRRAGSVPSSTATPSTSSSAPTPCSSTWTAASWSPARSHAFVTPNALVTVRHDDAVRRSTRVVARWDDEADLTKHGVGALLHGLLDLVVDTHFDAVESLDDQIEQLEDLLFDDRPHDRSVQRRSFELRKSLVLLRRVVLPMREVVNTLMRRDIGHGARRAHARTTRTSTTTCCARPSGPRPCATWSTPSWRPT